MYQIFEHFRNAPNADQHLNKAATIILKFEVMELSTIEETFKVTNVKDHTPESDSEAEEAKRAAAQAIMSMGGPFA